MPPQLTSDENFLSRFLVRNCDNWEPPPSVEPGAGRVVLSATDVDLSTSGVRFPSEPAHVVFSSEELAKHAPRWLWDSAVYADWKRAYLTVDLPDMEHELAGFPIFTQSQASSAEPRAPRWRQSNLKELDHTLHDALEYGPGGLWIKPELWAFRKGRATDFHYDYDPFNVVFQAEGSRRFHILPPRSGALLYSPLEDPWSKPLDYGTRWAQLNDTPDEYVVDLRAGEILRIPNGWPHRVEYIEDSIGFAVRSWTQCQALSLWLGQRLCLLSTRVGTARLCFDDEMFREHGVHEAMEMR